MKIICVGRNYVDHVRELNNSLPENPVLFMKPDSALLQRKKPFFIPDFSDDVHHEIEVVVKICRVGKNIQERFAYRYYDEVGLGIDFTARDIQSKLKGKGLPWELSKAFDGSAALGDFIKKSTIADFEKAEFVLQKNGEPVQKGRPELMIFSIDKIISYASRFFTLKIGDLIYTGTPAGVGPVAINDYLEGFLNGKKMLEVKVK